MTPALIKAEIQTGPHAATLATFVTTGNDVAIAAFLNDPNGAGKGLVTLTGLDKQTLLRTLLPVTVVLAGKTAAIQAKWDRLLDMVKFMESIPPADINDLLALAVTEGLLTQAKVDGLKTRIGSRAEVLWGAGRTVSPTDISESRRA